MIRSDYGDGEGKVFAQPAVCLRDGLQPQSEAMAHAHGQHHDGCATEQQLFEGKGAIGGVQLTGSDAGRGDPQSLRQAPDRGGG